MEVVSEWLLPHREPRGLKVVSGERLHNISAPVWGRTGEDPRFRERDRDRERDRVRESERQRERGAPVNLWAE